VRGDEPRLCRDGPDSRSSGRNALNVSMIKQNAVHTKVTPLAAIFEVNGVRLGPLGVISSLFRHSHLCTTRLKLAPPRFDSLTKLLNYISGIGSSKDGASGNDYIGASVRGLVNSLLRKSAVDLDM